MYVNHGSAGLNNQVAQQGEQCFLICAGGDLPAGAVLNWM